MINIVKYIQEYYIQKEKEYNKLVNSFYDKIKTFKDYASLSFIVNNKVSLEDVKRLIVRIIGNKYHITIGTSYLPRTKGYSLAIISYAGNDIVSMFTQDYCLDINNNTIVFDSTDDIDKMTAHIKKKLFDEYMKKEDVK